MIDPILLVNNYKLDEDWRVRENANKSYSYSGLVSHISGKVIAEVVLNTLYTKEIAEAHKCGDFHIHDLSAGIVAYCSGLDLSKLLINGFRGPVGKISTKPAKHFDSALLQIVNFLSTMQTEFAGAVSLSEIDLLLAPYVKKDNISYAGVRQEMQKLIYGLNVASRLGETIFSNLSFAWTVPKHMADRPVIYGGEFDYSMTYKECQKEMDMINRAFIEIMLEGDQDGKGFTFPIPTYNITKDFDWESDNADLLFQLTTRFGSPYFQNFVNSDLKPEDVRSMCCRLQLPIHELAGKTGGIFGAGENTGSIGVVTINLPRLGYLAKGDWDLFYKRLDKLMTLAKDSLVIKRNEVEQNLDRGLMPFTKQVLNNFNTYFNTIGFVGMNECCLNMTGRNIADADNHKEMCNVLDFMRKKLLTFQEETGRLFNLEATPAEGTCFRLAKLDRSQFPDIITSGTADSPYYTNSTNLPVGYTTDICEIMRHQEPLVTRLNGGSVCHIFIGELMPDYKVIKKLIAKVVHLYRIPYLTVTPTYSICPTCGYISGNHETCPHIINE